jgi:uncharacterized RDD family membrane protein YckC
MPPSAPPFSLDSGITAESPEGIEFTLFPAGPLIRSCAWGIDKGIQWILITLISAVSEFFRNEGGAWLFLLLIFCIDWFYHTLWELLCRGQSPGKLILGIRVIGVDGSPVSAGASFLRNLLRFADTFLFLCPVALTSMLLSRGFRRLGDWAGGTLVVYTAQSLAVSSPPGKNAAGPAPEYNGPAAGWGPLSGEEKQGILMFLRRYPLLGRARSNEIAAPFAAALRGNEDGGGPEDSAGIGLGPDPGAGPGIGPGPGGAEYLLGIGKRLLGG